MNTISLHRDDVTAITLWHSKYPDSEYLTINVDSSSGIGSLVTASLVAMVNGDLVTITKTVVDEASW